MIRIKSLQQRYALFMLLPVGGLLLFMGVVGFIHTRGKLLNQWGEAAILKLERASHHVDMRLGGPRELLRLHARTDDEALRGAIARQIGEMPGVVSVREMAPGPEAAEMARIHEKCGGWIGKGPDGIHLCGRGKSGTGEETGRTVSLVSHFGPGKEGNRASLEVVLSMAYLVERVNEIGWWQSRKAFLVNEEGTILAGTAGRIGGRLGDGGDPLEAETLEALARQEFGTVFGKGHPAYEVSGFYRLQAAPWYLVMFAPGKEILAPVIRFLLSYLLVGGAFILFILLLIRREAERTASAVRVLSGAADRVALGEYGEPLKVTSEDEVGRLTEDFNTMVRHLKERSRLKASMALAKEVQQNLLPPETRHVGGLDVAGASVYCDATGGDYYDFFPLPGGERERLGIAVGDVVGHGIAAALLMTTVRALLRSRAALGGPLQEIISHVNRHFCLDTADSCSFVTLFLMAVDERGREVRWVRAGHEPAVLYDGASDRFTELRGEGVALGVDPEYAFSADRAECLPGQLIFVGTDGIWETENTAGEMFGKERFHAVVRECRDKPSGEIVSAVMKAVGAFRGEARQGDDITLVVVRCGGESSS